MEKKKVSKFEGLTLGATQPVPISDLDYDLENPRFSEDFGGQINTEIEIIQYLNERSDLSELIESISNSGYVDIEPLVAMDTGSRKLIVLEGNRRLAAMKLLSDRELASRCDIRVPLVSKKILKTMKEVSVYLVAAREDAREFIGFKHINGPHRWDSIAKARFAADWYAKSVASGVTLKDISMKMGDRHDTIKRMVAGIYVLDQAKSSGTYDIKDRSTGRPFAFSHLYTALTRPAIREFLELSDDWRSTDPAPNPVEKSSLPELGQLLVWIYGYEPDKIEPIVKSQNPHIKQLSKVLSNKTAKAVLVSTGRLDYAYAEVDTPLSQFETALVNANRYTESALGKVGSFSGEDLTLFEIAKNLDSSSSVILETMERRLEKQK